MENNCATAAAIRDEGDDLAARWSIAGRALMSSSFSQDGRELDPVE